MTRGVKPSTIVAASSPVTSVPTPPSYLSKDAKAEWRRVAPILTSERNVLTVADLGTLENYVIALGTIREMHRLLQAEGYVVAGKRHPAAGILTAMQQQHLRCAGELGLTPAARSRAAMLETAEDDSDNPLAIQ